MVELIRQDGDSGVRVMIEGETTLGRGPLLKIDATNVSRQHAKISVEDGNIVVLTCLHRNPIMVKKGDWKELGKDENIALHDEDEFKFLENNYHFKVLVRDQKQSTVPKEGPSTSDTKKRKLPAWMDGSISSPSKKKRSPVEILSADKENEVSACNVASKDVDKTNDENRLDGSHLHSALNGPPMTSTSDSKTNSQDIDDFLAAKNPVIEALEVNPDKDREVEQNLVRNSSKDGSSPLRSSCMFGSSCYRKNPAHRVEEAHPGDDDYVDPADDHVADENDDRPECEFGTACYRKNPDHKRQFKHCKQPQPKRRAKEEKKGKIAKKKKEDDYDSGDSFIDDEEEDNWSPVDDSDDDEDWTPKLSQEYDE